MRALYRAILGREAESEAVIAHHLEGAPLLRDVVLRFVHSLESLMRLSARAGAALPLLDWDDTGIEVTTDRALLSRMLDRVRADWTQLGEAKPHYSVLTNPRFLPTELDAAREAEFFATAEEEVATFHRLCHRNGVAFEAESVLDFGCGIGRLGGPLAARFARYTGVDVSAPHLHQARARLAALGQAGAELMALDAFLAAPDRRWERVISLLTLQHSPPPVMRWMLLELLLRLAPGGVAIVQIPVQRTGYRFEAAAYLATPPRGEMEMHALPQRHVFAAVAEAGCAVLECLPDGRAGDLGQSCTFVLRRPKGAAQ